MISASPVLVTADLINAGSPQLADSSGYLVGPYTIDINGATYAALCVDFSDSAELNQSYSAYETQVGGNLANTYHPTFSTQYEEEAYLMSLLLKPNADRVDIQHAAWAITDSQYKANSAAEQYIQMAEANYKQVDFGQYDIISAMSADCDRTQEFLIDGGAKAAATPEPATMVLMGVGLVVAGLVGRKRARKAKA